PGSRVGHREDDPAVGVTRSERDASLLRCELDRVVQKVDENLGEAIPVRDGIRDVGREIEPEALTFPLRRWPDDRVGLRGDLSKTYGTQADPGLALLDGREIEEILDEGLEAQGVPVDHLHE